MHDIMAELQQTPYSEEELEHFRTLLEKQLTESRENITDLKASLEDMQETHDDTYSSLDHHQGNIGSEEMEEETSYQLIEREQQKVKEIKDALTRIEEGTYGICQKTREKIRKERLEAIPYARYSVDAQKEA